MEQEIQRLKAETFDFIQDKERYDSLIDKIKELITENIFDIKRLELLIEEETKCQLKF